MNWYTRFDIFLIVKTQIVLNLLGKKFGVVKHTLLINLVYLYLSVDMLSWYIHYKQDGFGWFWFIFEALNFILCAYYGPKLSNLSCRDASGPFRVYVYLGPLRMMINLVSIPMNLSFITSGLLSLLISGHNNVLDAFFWVNVSCILVQYLWAYVACCNDPPPKEKKQTFTRLAEQH